MWQDYGGWIKKCALEATNDTLIAVGNSVRGGRLMKSSLFSTTILSVMMASTAAAAAWSIEEGVGVTPTTPT